MTTPFTADGCQVFAALAQNRPRNLVSLSREVTEWLRAHPGVRVVHVETHLSGADGFVWQTIVLFYQDDDADRRDADWHSDAPSSTPQTAYGPRGLGEILGGSGAQPDDATDDSPEPKDVG